MTTNKKSAANMKVVEGDRSKASIEKAFENQRTATLATLEVQLQQDTRFDTLMGIREAWHAFHFDAPATEGPSFDYVRNIASDIKKIHEEIKKVAETMTMEQFSGDEWVNPADQFVSFSDPADWEDVFYQSMIFSGVQPYGRTFDDIRSRVMEGEAKRAK